jgi:hypothetical protein
MNLSENSLHAKLYRWFYASERLPNNLCPYFWKLMIALVFVLPTSIIYIPLVILLFVVALFDKDDTREVNEYEFGERMIISIMLYLMLFFTFCICVFFIELFCGAYKKDSFLSVCGALGFVIMAAAIVIGIIYLFRTILDKIEERREIKQSNYEPPQKSETLQMIGEFIKAKYNRYCPKITWK